MNRSESIVKLTTALVDIQGKLRGYAEDSDNPYFESKYGDLTSVWAAIRAPLSANGLAVIQTLGECEDPQSVAVTTTLAHTSGEWVSSTVRMKADRPGPQAIGSAITYARRYALAAIVGIAPADDDGEGATSHSGGGRKTKQKKAQRKADTTARTTQKKSPAAVLKTRHAAIMKAHAKLGKDRLEILLALCKTWNGDQSNGITLDTWQLLIDGAERGMDDEALGQSLRFSNAGDVKQVGTMIADYFGSAGGEGSDETR